MHFLLAALLTVVLIHYVSRAFRLRSIPGPFWAKFSNLWRFYHVIKGDWAEVLLDLHQRHGGLVRIGPDLVSLGDPRDVPVLYRTNPINKKGDPYKAVIMYSNGRRIDSMESTIDEQIHTRIRRPIAQYFTPSSVQQLEPAMEEASDDLIAQLSHHKVVDIGKWMLYYSIDNMNRMAFSKNLGFITQGKDVGGLLGMIRAKTKFLFYAMMVPRLAEWFNYLIGFWGTGWNPLVGLAHERLESRWSVKDTTEHKDLLSGFIQASRNAPDVYDKPSVLGTTLMVMAAGSDTTATAITFLLYHVVKNPRVEQTLRNEIDTAVQTGQLSYPPKWSQVSKLKYLDATIKEILRLEPPTRNTMDRVAGSEGLQLCGRRLPPGITVCCITETVHRNEAVYGPNARLFYPERWLEASDKQRAAMERGAIWFGAGKHVCIGQHIARMVMAKVITKILMRFELHDVNPLAEMRALPRSALGYADPEYFVRFDENNTLCT